jgi:hypothetical protein
MLVVCLLDAMINTTKHIFYYVYNYLYHRYILVTEQRLSMVWLKFVQSKNS